MAKCDLICLICDTCKEQPGSTEHSENSISAEAEAAAVKEGRRYKQIADAALVYVLGTIPGGEIQLDVYSGINGYHIRTIPAKKRWSNPVIIGAGAGLLAVVDRYNQSDVIRITDSYGGAGEAGFDSDGFPLENIAWNKIKDIKQVTTPTGTRCTGLSISPRGIIVINLDSDGSYMIADAVGNVAAYAGQKILGKPLEKLGTLRQSPSFRSFELDEESYQALGVMGGECNLAVLFNYLNGKIISVMGLPDGYDVLGGAIANDVVSVLLGNGGVGSKVIRFFMTDKSEMMAGMRAGKLETATGYTVDLAPAFMDISSIIPVTDAGSLHAYLRVSTKLNQSTFSQQTRKDDLVSALKNLLAKNYDEATPAYDQPGDLRKYDPPVSSDTLNDDRIQTKESLTSALYDIPIPYQVIDIPSAIGLQSIVSIPGTIIELFDQKNEAGDPDITKPLFRIVHGSYYDWILDGGFTYGCLGAKGNTVPQTSGIVGKSIAVDKSLRLGKLKQVDLKVAIIDKLTGMYICRPKPAKLSEVYTSPLYKFYGGDYVGLQPFDEDAEYRTSCSDTFDARAAEIDGISRPTMVPVRDEDGLPVEAWYNANDCDEPWSLFIRRAQAPKKVNIKVATKDWDIREPSDDGVTLGALLPEYKNMVNPTYISGQKSRLLANPEYSVASPTFEVTPYGGFFMLQLPKGKTTTKAKLQEQIADLQDQITGINNSLPLETDETRIKALNEQRDSIQAHLVILEEELANAKFETVIETPMTLIKHKFGDLALSPAQTIVPADTAYDAEDMTEKHDGLYEFSIISVGDEEDKKRGVVIDTDLRTWIAFDIKLNREGLSMNGKSVMAWPEAKANGLGRNVGDYDYTGHSAYADAFGISPSSIYEYGYRTFIDNDAEGVWSLKFFADGMDMKTAVDDVTGKKIFNRARTFDIDARAPEELKERLYLTLSAAGGVNIFGMHQGFLYYTDRHISTIEVECTLTNYAHDVYRFGYYTINIAGHTSKPNCPKFDPGFWAGDNCEASACGNVTCTSKLFGFKNHLVKGDPTYATTVQDLWKGRAAVTINDPYEEKNIVMGRFIECNVDFDLKAPISAYALDISSGAI